MNLSSLKKWIVITLMLVVSACATVGQNNAGTSNIYNETALTARARAHTDLGAAYLQQGKFEIALSEFTDRKSVV